MNGERELLNDAKELITYAVGPLKIKLRNLSKKYPSIADTFFEDAYVQTVKRHGLLEILKDEIKTGKFDLLYFNAPFGFGKTFFIEHLDKTIKELKFAKKYTIHTIRIDLYAKSIDEIILFIITEICEEILKKDLIGIVSDYFYRHGAILRGFSADVRERANSRELTAKDLDLIIGRIGYIELVDFIGDLLRRTFDEKETVCIFIVDELEHLAQEEAKRLSSYRRFFSKAIRKSREVGYWKLILSAPLEITEHEERHPLFEILFRDAADRLRDFAKEEYRLLFDVDEAVTFMEEMTNKTFSIIAAKSKNKIGTSWLERLEGDHIFPVDSELLEILAKTGLRYYGERGYIQDFRSFIALITYTIDVWLKHNDTFLDKESPPINFSFFTENSKEIQDFLIGSLEATELRGINRAVFEYNIDTFFHENMKGTIADFLLSLAERMKKEGNRKQTFALSQEANKYSFDVNGLLSDLKEIPERMRIALDLDVSNRLLRLDLDELGEVIGAEVTPQARVDPLYEYIQKVRELSVFDLLAKYAEKPEQTSWTVKEDGKVIQIDDCALGGRVILFDHKVGIDVIEKITKMVEDFKGPIFALKIDESDPKWPNSVEFFILPSWLEDRASDVLQFEKYKKQREKNVKPLSDAFQRFRDDYRIPTVSKLESLFLYMIPLWHDINGTGALPSPSFLDLAPLILTKTFIKAYTDTKLILDEFLKEKLGVPLPKTQIIISLLKFYLVNLGEELAKYDETVVWKESRKRLGEYGKIFRNYTFKAGNFGKWWSKPPNSFEEIKKELAGLGYVKDKVVDESFTAFSATKDLPARVQEIIKVLMKKLDKEKVFLPMLSDVTFGYKLAQKGNKVSWEQRHRLDSCLLLCILGMANLQLTLEVKNGKIYLNKNVIEAKRARLGSEIHHILAEEVFSNLSREKRVDISLLSKISKELVKSKKLKDVNEVALSLAKYERKKPADKEIEDVIEECNSLITKILVGREALDSENQRDKIQQFYIEFRDWIRRMNAENRDGLLLLLNHIKENLMSVLDHLTYLGKAVGFNKKVENQAALLGAYREFDERKERTGTIVHSIDKTNKTYGKEWFSKSNFYDEFNEEIRKLSQLLLDGRVECREAISNFLPKLTPELPVPLKKIGSKIAEIEKNDKELEKKLGKFIQGLETGIKEKEDVLTLYENVRKWQADISRLKRILARLRTTVKEYDLETDDLKELGKDFDATMGDIDEELNKIIDLTQEEKKLYNLLLDNNWSVLKVFKAKKIDLKKDPMKFVEFFIRIVELKEKTGIGVRL